MKERTTRSLLRSVALVGAVAAGATAFGGWNEFTAAGGTGYWEDATSWTYATDTIADWRIGNGPDLANGGYTELSVKFNSSAAPSDSAPLYIYGLPTTFTADDANFGLTKGTLVLKPSWGWGGALTLGTGTYKFDSVEANETLTLNGGTLAATSAGTSVTGTGTLVIGANGGTFAGSGAISVAITGSGTLTKTGEGTLILAGSLDDFTGKITVSEGTVQLGEGATATTITAGTTEDFSPVYTWTGAGTETTTTTTDPDTGDEVTTTTYADADLWSNVNNWLVKGKVPTAPPAADSTVVIPEGDGTALTIKCAGASDYTGYLTINRNVEFVRESSTQYKGITLTQVNGTGTLKISGNIRGSGAIYDQDYFNIYPSTESIFEINCALDTHGRIRLERVRESSTSKWSKVLNVKGALTGDGRIVCDDDTNSVQGMNFSGDTSAFAGTYEGCARNSWNRDATKFSGDARGSAAASWTFGRWEGNASQAGYTPFLVNDVTYQFGQLDAPLLHFWRGYTGSNTTGATVEVGALAGKTSTVVGSLAPNNTLRKVGATSTLEYTNSGTANGTVEANEGTTVILGTATGFTLNFTGTDATIKIARSSTTTTVVTPAVADDPETEEDETVEEVTETTTTTYIPATFVPGFADALVGCQYEVAQETVDNVTYDVYTVVKVAKDSADTEYYTVAAALAAIEADETLEKTVTLTHDYGTQVVLPLGYTLATAGYSCTVTGESGVAVSYDEETQAWTTADNSAAEWVGGAEGNWFDAANWSTGYVPNEGTAVTFNKSVTAFLDGNNTYHCGSIYLERGYTLTLAPVDYNEANWPRVTVHGNITSNGGSTLKLFRCGIDNGTDGRITVRPTVTFENTTGDSWFTGNFDLQAGLNGTGEFRIYGGTIHFATGSGIDVNEGSVVDFRNYYPTFAGSGGTLSSTGVNGDGRIIVHALPTSSALVYFQNAFGNAERWSGTLELAGLSLTSVRWLSYYGNENSTVSFNNTTTYLYTSLGTGGNHNVGIEVASGGLTIGGTYSQGNFVFPGKLTGTGTLTVAINGNNNKNVQFTGDCSEFAGTIAWASDTANTRVVVGDDTSADFTAGTIVVNEGETLGLGGFGGTLVGNGTVSFKAATTLGTFGEGWTGVAVADFALTSGANCQLNSLGTANSVVANGQAFTGHLNGNYSMVPALRLDNDFTFNNGSSSSTAWPDGKITKFSRILGDKNLNITWDNPNTGAVAYYEVEKIDGSYTGTINVSAKSALRVDEVALSAAPEAGVRLATIAVTSGGALVNAGTESVLDGAAVALTVGGASSDAVAVYDTDGLYLAVASVDVTTTPDEGDPVTTTTLFTTYEAAVAFADENSVTEFAVLFGDGAVNGWDYDSETGKLTKNENAIARIGTTQYDTLAAAFEDAAADDTVVLFGTCAEAVALAADGATLEVETQAYNGTLSGDGTVIANVSFAPVFGEWTGTFVVNTDTSAATSSTGWELGKFGVSGSTVVVAQPIAHGYLKEVGKSVPPSVAPAVYLKANVYIDNGYAGTSQVTTLAQLGSDEGVTCSLRYLANAAAKDATYYTVTKLKDFAGTFVLNAYNQLTIESVELAETPAVGTKVVNATAAATASVTAKIADGYPLVLKDDGLYFDPVAQVGAAYYNTLADAIAAANGATVELVKSTEEGVVVAAGQTVVIKFGEYTTGEITAASGGTLSTNWDETTKTGTYTCTAQGGVEPGTEAEYDTAEAANAATMAVPAAVEAALTPAALEGYKACFTKVVTAPSEEGGKYVVTYVLTETATTLVEEEFAEKLPTLNVAGLATATSESPVSVTVDAIPGLYYGVQSQSTLGDGAIVTTESSALATGETVTVTFPAADGSAAKFFWIFASPTDPAAATVTPGGDAGDGDDQS